MQRQVYPGSAGQGVNNVERNVKRLDHITFVEIDQLIISMVILPLPLVQEGQLSFTSKCMWTNIYPRAVNLAETSTVNMQICLVR